jgi:hypothetical protein
MGTSTRYSSVSDKSEHEGDAPSLAMAASSPPDDSVRAVVARIEEALARAREDITQILTDMVRAQHPPNDHP